MKQFNERTENGINIPHELLEKCCLNDALSAQLMEDVIVIRNQEMTTRNIINTIEALQSVIYEMYDILQTRFPEEECDCPFCDNVMIDVLDFLDEDNDCISVDDLTKYIINYNNIPQVLEFIHGIFGPDLEETVLCFDTKTDIVGFNIPYYDYDLTFISDETQDILLDNGICLGKINQSIMKGDIVYGE